MGARGWVLLTGATGFLGRYLLRDLLLAGQRVVVLARGMRSASAEERIAELVTFWSDTERTRLGGPVVLGGDLGTPGLGLTLADRTWLARHCRQVIHGAANISLRSALGEPWKTNVDGTRHLLALMARLGLDELHHVSTAFVCGDRPGPIHEDDLDCGQGFHNDYERSKCEAERLVGQAQGLRATIYRPSILVGDSRTGHPSSYHGFYRFLDLADRLAEPAITPTGRRFLPLRLPFSGDEPRNLVPVDWVAQAILRIVGQPWLHGRTYHLVAREPVLVRWIKEVAEEVLGIDGVEFAGPAGPAVPTSLEGMFLDHVRAYWPYHQGDPPFSYRNALRALPDFPAPRLDPALLARLVEFAVRDDWGRGRRARSASPEVDCARYVEDFFPEAVRHSPLAEARLSVTVALDVRGPGGGQWSCYWQAGELVEVRRGRFHGAEVSYRLNVPTFSAIVQGRLQPPEAFFAGQIDIEGDVEKGLKLAVLFGELVRTSSYAPSEATDACAAFD